jgi:signal transduction histidine kinase/integral membrane sensor domain MASE1/ActR/RegA family two-component response regulator
VLLGTIVYIASAKLGLSLAPDVAKQVSPVWPPTGIALAAVLLLGYRIWPAIALGAFVANATADESIGTAFLIGIGNTLEAVLGALLLRRFVGIGQSLERLKDVIGLAVLGAGIATLVSATIGVTSLCLADGRWGRFGELWRVWWLGDAVGALVVTPPLLIWAGWRKLRWRSGWPVEAGTLLIIAVTVSLIVFAGWPMVTTDHPLEFAIFPIVIWAALRFGPPGTSAAVLLISAVAIWGTVHDRGPFATVPVHEGLVLLQIFLGVVAVTGMVLAAATSERDTAQRRRAAVYAVTQVLTESAPLAEAARRILRTIGETLDWDVGGFWQLDRSAHALVCSASWSRPAPGLTDFEAVVRKWTFAPGRGLPGRVWASGRPAWIDDVLQDGDFLRVAATAQAGLHGAFAFPIVLNAEVVGVIEFFSREVRVASPDLLRLMGELGGQIGLFVERNQADEALRESDRRKDQFLAMLAHELRNPLAPIRNAVQILRLVGAGDDKRDWACGVIDRQTHHLSRLVDDLLEVSRIRSGQVQIRRQTLDLVELVRTAAEDRRAMLTEVGLRLSLDLPAGHVWVAGDATRLAQVLSNLLDNAAKFRDGGDQVTVRLAVDSSHGQAVLGVRDQGIGIEPALLPQLFAAFAQADRTLDRSRGGLGLGLALVKGLVELHGGSVQAASDGPGRGAEFTIRLPLKQEPPALDGTPTTASGQTDQPLRILVVEDNRDAAESLRLLLQILGHETAVAHTGPDGVRLAREWRPQVLLCDIGLPGMDGYDVARTLRREPAMATARLIAITGYGQAEDRNQAARSGFDDYLVKPVNPVDIQRLLTECATAAPRAPR